ncbi:hypothetical protein Tco_1477120 [Tanacetum coccineum]
MRLIQSLASKELVRNIPKLKFNQHFWDACKIGKQAHASHKAKNVVSMTKCLELLHMDIFGPSAVRSNGGDRYTLVIVDDYYSVNKKPTTVENLIMKFNLEEYCNANEPKNMNEALGDESWIVAMQEELNQFIANDVWELVPQPKNMTIIGTKAHIKPNIPHPDDSHHVEFEKEREGQVTRIRHQEEIELKNESYVLYDRVMTPLAAQLEQKPRRDHGTRRGCQSTSSSFAFDQPSSSHLNNDDDDGMTKGPRVQALLPPFVMLIP